MPKHLGQLLVAIVLLAACGAPKPAPDCGSSHATDAGTPFDAGPPAWPATCSSDTDCGSGACNTVGRVCMIRCNGAADCPDWAKNCDLISGATSAKVCQCQSDQICSIASNQSPYCNSPDKICEPGCSADSDCSWSPGRCCVNARCAPALDGG